MKNRFKLISWWGAAALALGILCCSGNAFAADPSPSPKADKSDATKGASAQLDDKDKDFMMTAAKGGMMEVHMGEMGQKQGKGADVKTLGKLMVTDHTKANNQLMALAKKKGVTLDTSHKMDKIDDADFDKEWLAQMVKSHEKTIAAFEEEAKDGKDADVKGWASKTLPTLKKHLKMIQDAQGKMEKKTS